MAACLLAPRLAISEVVGEVPAVPFHQAVWHYPVDHLFCALHDLVHRQGRWEPSGSSRAFSSRLYLTMAQLLKTQVLLPASICSPAGQMNGNWKIAGGSGQDTGSL